MRELRHRDALSQRCDGRLGTSLTSRRRRRRPVLLGGGVSRGALVRGVRVAAGSLRGPLKAPTTWLVGRQSVSGAGAGTPLSGRAPAHGFNGGADVAGRTWTSARSGSFLSSVTVRAAPACSPMARQRRSATDLSRPRRLAGYLRSRVRGTVPGAVNASARRAMAAMPGATPRIPRPGGARRGRRTAAGSHGQRRRVSRRAHADRRVGQVRRRRSGPTSTRRSSKRHIELSHRPGRSSCAAARAAPAPGPSRPDRRRSQARCVVACLGETADGMSATRWCRSSSAPVSPARRVRVSVANQGFAGEQLVIDLGPRRHLHDPRSSTTPPTEFEVRRQPSL
jgi:hypothetical protein